MLERQPDAFPQRTTHEARELVEQGWKSREAIQIQWGPVIGANYSVDIRQILDGLAADPTYVRAVPFSGSMMRTYYSPEVHKEIGKRLKELRKYGSLTDKIDDKLRSFGLAVEHDSEEAS